jgi:asparagine synthase (glutamine-hydrolysing)
MNHLQTIVALQHFSSQKKTKEKIKVALTGIGGDETFGGYPRYWAINLSSYYNIFPLFLRKGINKFIPKFINNNRILRFIYGSTYSFPRNYISWLTFIKNSEKENLYSSFFKNEINIDVESEYEKCIDKINSIDFRDKIFYLDWKTYLADDLLILADRMSMANSLEIRVPFCDHKLLEFCASIPFEYKIKNFSGKYIYKKTITHLLPNEILHRKKQGFVIPLSKWLKNELKYLPQSILSEDNVKKRNLFNYDFVKNLLNRFFSGEEKLVDTIWSLSFLELWMRKYVDK